VSVARSKRLIIDYPLDSNTDTIDFDSLHINTLTVEVTQGELVSATEAEVVNGANALAVDVNVDRTDAPEYEIIQFVNASQVSTGVYELSQLLRGRRGTERLVDQHSGDGATVVQLDNLQGVQFVERDSDALDQNIGLAGVTFNKLPPSDAEKTFTYQGYNLTPLSPVHIRGKRNASNADVVITWRRRTRSPGNFFGRRKGPLLEESEEYEVDVLDGGSVVRTLTTTNQQVTYTESQQVSDFGSVQDSYDVRIYQMSQAVGRGWPGSEAV